MYCEIIISELGGCLNADSNSDFRVCSVYATNSAKKKVRILWTCYAIRWTGKKNDAGTRRRRGRPRRKWMDEIHEVTGMKLAELRDVTAERKHWRRMVKTVARTRRVDSTR